MIKLAIAGTQEFIEFCREQAALVSGIVLVHTFTEAHNTVSVLEENIDALVLGFDHDKNQLVLEAACRREVKVIRFVSVSDYKEQLNWMRLRANSILKGKELEGVARYFALPSSSEPQLIETEKDNGWSKCRVEAVREKIENSYSPVAYRHKIITFLSRGGQGQSSLIASLAENIVQTSKLDVCILDLDCTAPPGDIARLFGFRDNKFPSLSSFDMRLSRENILNMVVKIKSGVYILPAVSEARDRDMVKDELLREALTILYRYFKLIMVDTSLSMEAAGAAAAKMSDETFFITSPEILNLEWLKTYSQILIKQYNLDTNKMSLIVNRAMPKTSYKAADIATFMALPCDFTFYEDSRIRQIWDSIKPLNYNQLPNEFKDELEKLSRRIFPAELFSKNKAGFLKIFAPRK